MLQESISQPVIKKLKSSEQESVAGALTCESCTGVNLRLYLLLGQVLSVLGFSELLSEFCEGLCVLDVLLLELLDFSVKQKVPLSPALCVGGVVES